MFQDEKNNTFITSFINSRLCFLKCKKKQKNKKKKQKKGNAVQEGRKPNNSMDT